MSNDKPLCNMGMDCERHNACYAAGMGRLDMCGKPPSVRLSVKDYDDLLIAAKRALRTFAALGHSSQPGNVVEALRKAIEKAGEDLP